MAQPTMGQLSRLTQLLSGYSAAQVQGLLEAPDLLDALLESDLTKVDRRRFTAGLTPFDPASMFTGRDEMIKAIRQRAQERDWPLTPEQLDAACEALPSAHLGDLECFSFDIWLGDFTLTYNELWLWLCDMYGSSVSKGLGYHPRATFLRPLHYRSVEPRLGVIGLDMGAHWSADRRGATSPSQVREKGVSWAGLELLAAAALHPEWLVRTGCSREVPGVWLLGLQTNPQTASEPWSKVPLMRWNGESVFVSQDEVYALRPNYAIPYISSELL